MLNNELKEIELYYVAHARSGDKGDTLSIGVFPYELDAYEYLDRQLTAERVKQWFGSSVKGEVIRFELPKLSAFNFILYKALEGGVSESLSLDTHGKTRSGLLLAMPVLMPKDHIAHHRKLQLNK